jgi:protein-S-isoprenylcysteine O-methyltransferase Ste14
VSLLARIEYPPLWLLGFMGLAWALGAAWAPWGDALLWPGRAFIGLGIALAVWAAVEFRRARTTIVPGEEPAALVERGPYRFSRNPIYVADLMILAGFALIEGTPLGLLLVVPFQQVLLHRFVLKEEAILAARLGAPYEAYRARVRRWI